MVKIKTPCIGICSTTSVGDRICRGCKRYAVEVIDWNGYSDDEKLAVLSRIEKLNVQILENRLRIFSVPNLVAGMNAKKVPFDETLSPYCWLHNLLKRCHRELESLEEFGVYVRQEYRHLELHQLLQQIDDEIMALCAAHYTRYIDAAERVGRTVVADAG